MEEGGQKKRKLKRPDILSCLKLDINPYHQHHAAVAEAEYKFFAAKKVRSELL